jgi:hypothetical protein
MDGCSEPHARVVVNIVGQPNYKLPGNSSRSILLKVPSRCTRFDRPDSEMAGKALLSISIADSYTIFKSHLAFLTLYVLYNIIEF